MTVKRAAGGSGGDGQVHGVDRGDGLGGMDSPPNPLVHVN